MIIILYLYQVTIHWSRKEGAKSGDKLETSDITVTLVRKPGKGLGLSVVGRRDGPGVYISALVPGGVAEGAGLLCHGDQIIMVNDRDLTNSTQVRYRIIGVCMKGIKGDLGTRIARKIFEKF